MLKGLQFGDSTARTQALALGLKVLLSEVFFCQVPKMLEGRSKALRAGPVRLSER